MSHQHHHLSRRDFLKIAGTGMGAMVLAGCNKGMQVTAIPGPTTTTRPVPNALATIPALAPGEFVDTILVNGNIVTMDAKRTSVKALAIKKGIIHFAGDDQAVRNLAGDKTQVIDLGGRTVTPGLNDAHCHLSACGLLGTAYVDLSWPTISTVEQMQDKFAEWIAKTPKGEWVVGSGWMIFEGRYPNKHDLDPVSPNHPVFATNMGGHMAVVNSLALEMAGVNDKTPDPGNGRFLREANGEPDGTVLNHPAMDYFRKLWPTSLTDVKTMEVSILGPQARFAANGVTSFQDVYARDLDRMQAYFNLGKRGEMTIRGQVMNVLEYIQELNGRIEALKAMRFRERLHAFRWRQVPGGRRTGGFLYP